MNHGRVSALGILVLVLVAGTLMILGVIAFVRRDMREPIGGEIVYDDFGFSVLGVETADRVGSPALEVRPHGTFEIVHLQVANHAKRVDYHLDNHRAVLEDANGLQYETDLRAQAAYNSASTRTPVPDKIAAGESCITDLVFDVPSDAHDLTLRIAWGGRVIDALDWAFSGDRRIVLK